jgi:hypothetical protein
MFGIDFLNSKIAWLYGTGGNNCEFACVYNYCFGQMSFVHSYYQNRRESVICILLISLSQIVQILVQICATKLVASTCNIVVHYYSNQTQIIHDILNLYLGYAHLILNPMNHDAMWNLRHLSQLLIGSSLILSSLDVIVCSSRQNPIMNWHGREISISRLQALLFVLDDVSGTSLFIMTGLPVTKFST